MRMLVLSDYYPPHYIGGYELICEKVIEGLVDFGYEVCVLTSTHGVEQAQIDGHVHRRLRVLDRSTRISQIKSIRDARFNYQATYQTTREFAPDLCFSWSIRGLSILPALAVQDAGVKIVFSLESHWLAHSRLYYVNEPNRIKRLYRSAQITLRRFEELRYDAATFSSESLRQSHEDVGVIFDQQAVIPNFIWKNVNIASGKETVGQPLRLLYAGRFSYAKGTDVAVNAVAHLVNAIGYRDVHLTLIGHGDEAFTQHLHEIIRTAHLEAYVDIRGFMPHDELMQCYADFDVLLFPTPEWEGFGMTILEAMSQGVPAIASNIGGPRDIVQHERTGLLVPPSDPAAMAAAIHDLAQSSDKLLTMSQAGVDVVKQHYAADIALKRFDEFLRRVGESASAEEVRF